MGSTRLQQSSLLCHPLCVFPNFFRFVRYFLLFVCLVTHLCFGLLWITFYRLKMPFCVAFIDFIMWMWYLYYWVVAFLCQHLLTSNAKSIIRTVAIAWFCFFPFSFSFSLLIRCTCMVSVSIGNGQNVLILFISSLCILL